MAYLSVAAQAKYRPHGEYAEHRKWPSGLRILLDYGGGEQWDCMGE